MKTTRAFSPSRTGRWPAGLLVLCTCLSVLPAHAIDRIRIPLPPSPGRVVNDIRGFFHRLAGQIDRASQARPRVEVEVDVDPYAPNPAYPLNDPEAIARSRAYREPRYYEGQPVDPRGYPYGYPPDVMREEQRRYGTEPREFEGRQPSTLPKNSVDSERKPITPPETGTVDPAPLPENPRTTPAPNNNAGTAKKNGPTIPPDSEVQFARPVPGKRGFVYPPGSEEKQESIVDVRDFQPGQVVRDPRTKKLFRVP